MPNERYPKIICVDDEEQILNSLVRCLRSEEYELVVTRSPDEVLRFVRNGGVEVVISDYRMPERTGLELLSQVRELDSCIVGIMLSGFGESEQVQHAIREGQIHQFLKKPWDPRVLRSLLTDFRAEYRERKFRKAA